MPEQHPMDDPEKKRRIVRMLLVMTPAMFVFCYLLAWSQGAETRYGVLIAAVGAGMSASAALAIQVMGSKAWMALVAVKVALLLLVRR